MLRIAGFTKLTLLDYPGKLACTIFTPGCQLRCPFCHNASLVITNHNFLPEYTLEEILAFLKKRSLVLEAVCISGGEPLLQEGIEDFIHEIKSLGYFVKLDTNGGFPEKLSRILDLKLLDYIAMDIKNGPSTYAKTCGVQEMDLSAIKKSISLIQNSKTQHEFRTTVVMEFHKKADLLSLAEWNIGNSPLFLQFFQASDHTLSKGLHGYGVDEMEDIRQCLLTKIPNTKIRGLP